MRDSYLYPDVDVLKNKLGIKDESTLDRIEAEYSRANMQILYSNGYNNFSKNSVCDIHKKLFEDVYDWAEKYRTINLIKREELLAGKSVWYSDVDNIERDLNKAWKDITKVNWSALTAEEFAIKAAHLFPSLWQTHPFREGNTRTVVTLLVLFIESYGYYVDKLLLAKSAGYVRNAFVLASFDQNSEYVYLERILKDAICTEPIAYNDEGKRIVSPISKSKYKKYNSENYKAKPHSYVG